MTNDKTDISVEEPVHIRWPSIELLHNVRKRMDALRELYGESFAYPVVRYRAKVKLDGTNAGVQVLASGDVAAQSRSQLLASGNDNAGFFQWVDENRDYFAALTQPDRHLTLFGEWCGSGIQRGTAVCQIGRKVFAVFAAQFTPSDGGADKLFVWPDELARLLQPHPDIFVLPWHEHEVSLNFGDREQLLQAVSVVNRWVDEVEANDPWVSATFDKSGVGEGIVLYPIDEHDGSEPSEYMKLAFKAKGQKHQVVKQKRPAQIAPEVAESIEQFVDMFATVARLEQGAAAVCPDGFDMKKIPVFLRWIRDDVRKESTDELDASKLTWRQVDKAVSNKARSWYIEQARRV